MARELDHVRRRSEELVRRNFGTRAGRERARRHVERGARSLLRRLRNAALTFAGLLVLMIAGFATGSLGLVSGLLALVAAFIITLLVLFWPSRRRPAQPPRTIDGGDATRLDRLAAQAEAYLLDRNRALPQRAAPALDRIVARLHDLEPSLETVPADTLIGGDARRLIGQHLPGLIDNYLALPPSERPFDGDNSRRLAESLAIVADELDELCERIGEERRTGFETERRFLEARYRDGDRLSLDRPG